MLEPPDSPQLHTISLAFCIAGSIVTRDKRQKHVALAYRSEGGDLMMLHLAWHQLLKHHQWDGQYYWVPFRNVDQEVLETFADWAVAVATGSSDSIPYSAHFEAVQHFDSDGHFIKQTDGSGLTCATFLLALFHDWGLPLIDPLSWPRNRPGDLSWLRRILKALRECVSPRHWIEQVRRRHLLQRFRPEEVAAIPNIFTGTALSFDVVHPAGALLLARVPA